MIGYRGEWSFWEDGSGGEEKGASKGEKGEG